jgi:hypothetical protein
VTISNAYKCQSRFVKASDIRDQRQTLRAWGGIDSGALMALRFSQTSQNQVMMVNQVRDRVLAQLDAYSAKNKTIFLVLSKRITRVQDYQAVPGKSDDLSSVRLNYHSQPIVISNSSSVQVQDLNGLLPQRHPNNVMWSELLSNMGLTEVEVDEVIGTWSDFQDPDIDSWIKGDQEPKSLPSGHDYLNGFSQSSLPLEWIFSRFAYLVPTIEQFSNVDSPRDVNIRNMPDELLTYLFDATVSTAIKNDRTMLMSDLTSLLPQYSQNASMSDPRWLRIEVTSIRGQVEWRESSSLIFAPLQQPPFDVLSAGL